MTSNTNPSPFAGKDGEATPGYYAIVSGIDASGNVDALKTNGSGVLLTSVSGAGSGGTSATDDAAFTPGTDAGTPIMGIVTADSVDSGDAGVVGMTTDRHLKINIASSDVSMGGGTQYTDGDADASPTGTVAMFDNAGTMTAVSDTSPLPVLASIDTTGLATSARQDTLIGHVDGVEALLGTIDTDTGAIATSVASLDTKTPALGQALAAASVPVVLTAAQITALTPPAAITGFGTAANQTTIIGHVDGIEGLLTTIDADTSVLAATDFATEAKQDAIITAIGAIPGGGGTQYTEGDTDASITGTALMMEGAANALVAAPGTAADGLLVNLGANNDVTVSGVSTAANQTTIIGHLDGVEGLLTTIDADTGEISAHIGTLSDAAATAGGTGSVSAKLRLATSQLDSIKTAVETLDNAISGSEMQVDIVSSELPTGASTLAEQQTQTTALQILDNPVVVDDAAFTPATTSVMMAGFEFDDTTPDSVNEGDAGAARMSANRNIYTTIRDAAGNERGVNVNASNQLAVAGPVTVASAGIASGAIASGAVASGAFASGSIASGAIASGAIAAGAIAAGATSIATTEDTASAAADHLVKVAQIRLDTPVSGANTSGSGDYTQFIADSFGKTWTAGTYPEDLAHVAGEPILGNGARRIDTAASSAGTSGDWATVDASAEGALWATLTPTTTSGCTIFKSIDLDESEEEVKSTAGNVYGYYVFNAAASVAYLKFYNATAANVTVGTTTPVATFPVPAGAAANVSFAYPIGFSTAICAAVTTGLADNDTGAPAANAFIANIFYK